MGKTKPTLSRPTQRMTKRERSRWERERRIQRNLVLAFAAIGIISILLIGFALYYDNIGKPGRVIARVNGEPVTMRDYWSARRMALTGQYQQQIQTYNLYAQMGITMTTDQTTQFQDNMRSILLDLGQVSNEKVDDATVQSIVQEKVLVQGARGLGLNPTDQDVIDWLIPAVAPTPTPAGVFGGSNPTQTAPLTPTVQPTPPNTLSPQEQNSELETQAGSTYAELVSVMDSAAAGKLGFSRGEYIVMVRHSLLISYLQQKVQDKLAESLPQTEDQVHVSQILIADRKTRAQTAEQAVRSGQPFPQTVVKYSDDSAGRDKIGDLGWIYRGERDTTVQIETAAFAITQTGGFSPVVSDTDGLHILQLIERDDAKVGVHIRHILIPVDRRSVADGILTSLKANAPFDQMAQARSEDKATAASGGDMGWIKKGDPTLSQPVLDAAFALSGTNALSPVVQDATGYHILQLLERNDAQGQVHVRQILILTGAGLAQQVLEQVKSGTLDFSQAVANYSTDQGSVVLAGDLGWIKKDDTTLSPAVLAAAFAITQTGGISPIVEDSDGYHILQVWDRNDPDSLLRVRQILVKPAEKLANEIHSFIVTGDPELLSARFQKEALAYSDDTTSRSNGGDMGWFGRGTNPEIEQVAFSQDPGQVSEVFTGTAGLHIVWTREHDPQHPLSADTLKTKAKAAYDDWLKKLTDAATVERFPAPTPTPVPTAAPTIESNPAITGTVTP